MYISSIFCVVKAHEKVCNLDFLGGFRFGFAASGEERAYVPLKIYLIFQQRYYRDKSEVTTSS